MGMQSFTAGNAVPITKATSTTKDHGAGLTGTGLIALKLAKSYCLISGSESPGKPIAAE